MSFSLAQSWNRRLFSPTEKVRGTSVSLGSSPLGRYRRELPGRLIPQPSSWHRGGPGSPACAGCWAERCTKAGWSARYRGAPGGGRGCRDPVTTARSSSHAGREPRPVGSLCRVNTFCRGPHPVPSSRGPPPLGFAVVWLSYRRTKTRDCQSTRTKRKNNFKEH